MGIYSRDYLREEQPRPGGFTPRANLWALKYLLIANIAVFVLQMAMQRTVPEQVLDVDGNLRVYQRLDSVVTNALSLDLSHLAALQIWRLVSYGFCHGGMDHLMFNMFALWIFGRLIEPIYGSREFLAFYLTGVVISGLCHVLLQWAENSPAGVIGASGGVMSVVFLTAMCYPRMTVLLFFVVPVQMRWLAVLYAVVDVWGLANAGSDVAHAAHLGGAAFGVLYRLRGWKITDWLAGVTRVFGRLRKANPGVRIYDPGQPPPVQDDLEPEVDRILGKISQQGEHSLTDSERKTLSDASRRARRRMDHE
ncbi:MAG: rhomboid family intramembrane serine protease [Planctomycetaceae bacterium]